ncbi:MAG: hypothetical protein IPL95_14250 [Saprospiraceae bacterium]|nr:hypothetical protein [Saprospiraceae bacterium]
MKKEQPEPRKIVIKKKTREVSTEVQPEESTNISSPIDLSNQNNFKFLTFFKEKAKATFFSRWNIIIVDNYRHHRNKND